MAMICGCKVGPGDPVSPEMLRAHARHTLEGDMRKIREGQERFQTEVREALAALAARKAEAAQTTAHGVTFEDAVAALVTRLADEAGDLAEACGQTTGVIRNCKVGDVLVTMGDESAAPGARIVIEAKAAGGYARERILEEAKTALENRRATVAIFVLSRDYAEEGAGWFERVGRTLIACWDHEDARTDIYLRAACSVARALAVAEERSRAGKKIDLPAIERAVANIGAKLEGLEDVNTWAETAKSSAEKIITRVRTVRTAVVKGLETLAEAVTALK